VRVVCRGGLAPFGAAWLSSLGAAAGVWPLARADAVIVSGAAAFGAARLAAAHPHLIVAAITPFGLDGPRAHWRSCDTVAQALGGMLLLNGHRDEPPLRALGAQAYECAGLQAALGIALALLARRRDGAGQVVDVSLHESVVASLEHVTGRYRQDGTVAARQGSLHWSGAFRVARCRDGDVLLSHLGDWSALLEWLKADGAAADLVETRWRDESERRRHAGHVFDVLAAWAQSYRRAALLAHADLLRLPFAAVQPRSVGPPPPWCAARAARERPCAEPHGAAMPRAPAGAAGPAAGRPPTAAVLDGVRVLDFTWVVAGPLATRVLADFGADVVKIERRDAPDDATRRGGLFGNLNRGKRSLALDMADAGERAIARTLARHADIVIDNFNPRVMPAWQLDAAAIHADNPGAIVVGLSAFGRDDARVGYGPTVQAVSGFTWHMRHPGGAPAGLGFAYADVASGYATALAVVAALWRRGHSGAGVALDVVQAHVAARLLHRAPALPDAAGNVSPEGAPAPHGVYRCADVDGAESWIAIAVFDDAAWRQLAALIGQPWAAEPRYAGAASRRQHAAALEAQLAAWLRRRDALALTEELQAVGVCAGVCADARLLCEADRQLAARGYFVDVDGARVDGPMPRLLRTPGRIAAAGPRRDQHRSEVLRALPGMEQNRAARR
jgi:crotonobetainyl-CoA:carnitine CoA-transferase CaiB-like acyl-CoA transferase